MNKTMSAIKGALYALSMVAVMSVNAMTVADKLCDAASRGRLEDAINLLSGGADPNGVGNATNCQQHKPMFCAIEHGQTLMIKLLLLAGAELNAPNANNQTPLGYARTLDAERVAYAAEEALAPLEEVEDLTKSFCLHSTSYIAVPRIINLLVSKGAM